MKYGVVGNRVGWTKEQVFNGLKKVGINSQDIIVSGGARGVDTFAQEYAKMVGSIFIIMYPKPELSISKRYFERNRRIVVPDLKITKIDELIAFDKKEYSGTLNTINQARDAGSHIVEYKE